MFRTPIVLDKPYLVLNPLALEHLELSEEFNLDFIKQHSKTISFDELSTLVFWIDGGYAQYAIASKAVEGLKAMSAFSCDESSEETTKREDICIYDSEEEVERTRKVLWESEDFEDLHTLKLFSMENNKGIAINLPDGFGTEHNGKIVAAYFIKEKSGFRPMVKPVLLSKASYNRYQSALEAGDSVFNTISEFFIER